MQFRYFSRLCLTAIVLVGYNDSTWAQSSEPEASYIFPAGMQRGTTAKVTVGGLFLLQNPWFEISDAGIQSPARLQTGETLWFDGPQLIGQRSLEKDDYPKDHTATLIAPPDANTGVRYWRVWTAQGGTPARSFVIGELPEVVEQEADGDPMPVRVSVPLTINGRIFPRTDLDVWTFHAEAGVHYVIELDTKRIMSPLDGRIALFQDDHLIADDIGTQKSDPVIRFCAERSGPSEVHVHDIGYQGSQACVYRLTIREGVRTKWVYPLGGRRGTSVPIEVGLSDNTQPDDAHHVEVDLNSVSDGVNVIPTNLTVGDQQTEELFLSVSDLPEVLEMEPNDSPDSTSPVVAVSVLNGRIDKPGDKDLWPIAVREGQKVELQLTAGKLQSKLQPVLSVLNSAGNPVAPTDSQPVSTNSQASDVQLSFTAESDSTYWICVQDQFPSRGGPDFGYRLQTGTGQPSLELLLDKDVVKLGRGSEATTTVRAIRSGGLEGDIQLVIEGLPPETEATELLIPADKDEVSVKFTSTDVAPVGGHSLRIHGNCLAPGNEPVRATAATQLAGANTSIDDLLLSITEATPFKLVNRGPYYAFAHVGTVYHHPFAIDRGGFEGPVTIRLADRQRRHLQGIRGLHDVVVPAGASEFEFPFQLAPEMSRDRLRRCLVMAVALVTDEQGNQHQVAFTDGEQSQAPINIQGPRLGVTCEQQSLFVRRSATAQIEFHIQRDPALNLPAEVEVIVPDHLHGFSTEAVLVPADVERATADLKLDADAGPFNMPLTVRVTVIENGDPVIAESQFSIVIDDRPSN